MLDTYELPDALYDSGIKLPDVAEWERDEILDEIAELCTANVAMQENPSVSETILSESHLSALFEIVDLVESMMSGSPERVPLFRFADLAMACRFPGVPMAIGVQIAFGREIGIENRRKWMAVGTEARLTEKSVAEYIGDGGPQVELMTDRPVRLFRGEETRGPSTERLRRGIALVRRALALLPVSYRAGLLGTLAWLQWASGRRPVAMAYLSEACRVDPRHPFAALLAHQFSSRLPAWCDA